MLKYPDNKISSDSREGIYVLTPPGALPSSKPPNIEKPEHFTLVQ